MNSLQIFLMFIAMFFMKVFATGTELTINMLADNELGEITPPTTYTIPKNTPTLQSNGDDDEIIEIFTGVEDRNSASFKVLLEELPSSRLNNDIVSVAQSSAERIANRTPTPYFRIDEITEVPLNAVAQKLSTSCAAIEEENSTLLKAAAELQTDAVSGWAWWYRWLSSFIS